ncbi:MAG: DUF2007 domain-containing protein [bacterium]|nr:MAG: DUF2007 domain-containing protein [bacterium]
MADTLVTLSTHATVLEAELVRGRLLSAGIEAHIHAPHANALYPGVLGEVRLQVSREDLDMARRILAGALDEDPPPEGSGSGRKTGLSLSTLRCLRGSGKP